MTTIDSHRCGFVTLIGRTNVGKSTLLNTLLGEKLAITSHRPQTTRNRIPGVLTRADAQIIFIDTPGVHRARSALNRHMLEVAHGAIAEAEVIALLVEPGLKAGGEATVAPVDQALMETLAKAGRPVFLIVNKIDLVRKPRLLPLIDAYRQAFEFAEIVPVSAKTGNGVDRLVERFAQALPLGPRLYPEDTLTDLPERFLAAELVREKLFRQLDQELPYSTAVTVESWKDRTRDGITEIQVVIHVERESQKGIVIGAGGARIKQIGIDARQDLERLLATQVFLSLFVRVEGRWTRSTQGIRKLGYE